MREALIETGIGETRAILIEGGAAAGLRIEREGPRPGDYWDAPLLSAEARTVRLGDGEAVLDRVPAGVAEGALVRVEVRRAAIPERGRTKPPRAALLDAGAGRTAGLVRAGPDLAARLGAEGWVLRQVAHVPGQEDALEAAGWSELVAEAEAGELPFPGGLLRLERTAAFLAIDVDGGLPAGQLAIAAARAVAAAIRRFDLGGSIVVDFPTLADRAARTAVADAFDAAAPAPFERTAINGFGLMQVVRPLARPSVIDLMQGDPAGTRALAALRRAERETGAGVRRIAAGRAAAAWLAARPALIAELERRTGARAEVDAGR